MVSCEHEALTELPSEGPPRHRLGLVEGDVALHLLGELHATTCDGLVHDDLRRRCGSRPRNGAALAPRLLQRTLDGTVRHRRDRERWIRSDGTRHGRAVDDEEVGMAERLVPRVDDALVHVAAHRRPAERVHGDHALGPPQRIVAVGAAERLGDVPHRLAHRVEVRRARRGGPLDIHLSVAEGDASVGSVAAHPEERERARREPALTDQLGDLGRDRRLVPIAQAVPDHLLHDRRGPLHGGGDLRGLDEPVGEVGEAGLLDVVPAARALLVHPVGLTDGGGDDRSVRGVDDPQLTLLGRRLGVEAERDQIAVAAEAAAERVAERGQADPVAQEERRGAERPRAEVELIARDA